MNDANGLCLDRHDDTRLGAKLILWYCNDKWNQVFKFNGATIANEPLAGHVVDVPGGTSEWGTQLIIWERNGGQNQVWWKY